MQSNTGYQSVSVNTQAQTQESGESQGNMPPPENQKPHPLETMEAGQGPSSDNPPTAPPHKTDSATATSKPQFVVHRTMKEALADRVFTEDGYCWAGGICCVVMFFLGILVCIIASGAGAVLIVFGLLGLCAAVCVYFAIRYNAMSVIETDYRARGLTPPERPVGCELIA